jgi:hypothetical protein
MFNAGKAIDQRTSGDLYAPDVGLPQLALCGGLLDRGGHGADHFGIVAQQLGRPPACLARPASERQLLPWAQLMVSFGKRVPAVPLYTLFLIPLLAVMAVRLIAMASSRSPRMARAS